jgi:hypothetical protein
MMQKLFGDDSKECQVCWHLSVFSDGFLRISTLTCDIFQSIILLYPSSRNILCKS